ncbi:UPF0103-domain-containing protein [Dacryopinax primogenitus]|uniref:UPF0103-domain-containing protein n=1 Tax=Dacryopinax primogenitus (strain DJM 731) TaxID=1858805 RepID=M5G979_DACPD|nr:UPF0103-domain-containing protein [Dacryopinax primogenitus]EJU05319.1 UPF0103-domain-containing protein [Dacryopinax primogenitus]
MMSGMRRATHANSWYSGARSRLDHQLKGWLSAVEPSSDYSPPIKGCKAIIGPHAGYDYSGPTAAWAYKAIDVTGIKRVFLLGPSHHVYLDGCALTPFATYDTPLGELPVDLATTAELKATGKFSMMSNKTDENEHSIELHLPYVRKTFEGCDIKVVPILVGAINDKKEADFGGILAQYLEQEDTMFVVSSDFCHWGERFDFTFYYPGAPSPTSSIRLEDDSDIPRGGQPIHESISRLDHEAINMLTLPTSTSSAKQAHASLSSYLRRTGNTICGRHPIGVLLGALATLEEDNKHKASLKFVKYAQSSPCKHIEDSSVSYASAYVTLE